MRQLARLTFLVGLVLVFIQSTTLAQAPSIVINGDTTLADNNAKFPFWLNQTSTLAIGDNVNSISVIEFTVADNDGVQSLNFNQVLLVTTQQSVPAGKVWKVESVALKTAAYSQGSGDNWGGQSVVTNTTLAGGGTSGSTLGIAQQGATANQVLQWDGSTWLPADASAYTNSTLTGNGTPGNPFGIAQQGATSGQVLVWNGSAWAPAPVVPAAANCPSGFTAVNNKFCIETTERVAATFWNAHKTCQDLNYSLASWNEWRYSCQKSGLSPALVNMTNNWEWVGDINSSDGSYDATKGFIVGNGGCAKSDHPSNSGSSESSSWTYRCVFYR